MKKLLMFMSRRFLPMFFSKSFMVSLLTFRLKQGLKHQLRKRALGTPGWEMQVVEGGQGKYGKQGSVCYIDIQSVLSPLMNLL